MEKIIFFIFAIIVGVTAALQGPLNIKLGSHLGSDYWAAIASFVVTFLVGTVIILAIGLYSGVKLPSMDAVKSADLWKYLGGVFGVIYVLGLILIIPSLGVGLTTVVVLFSQLLMSMIIDHFGLFGNEIRSFNLYRISAILLMALAIYFINKR